MCGAPGSISPGRTAGPHAVSCGGIMFSVTREINFCYGHRLLEYSGKCKHLHGHNGKAVITLEAVSLDELGMVMDFTRLKRVVGGWIDETLDHKMLLRNDDPVLDSLRAQGEPVYVLDVNPTAENIAKLIFDYTAAQGFPVTEVRLWETESCYACYRRGR
jgi:6-pyruvoyltetrahydropterin/6-carboxytetrahydropterin synthase